jgi:hypothetical protein
MTKQKLERQARNILANQLQERVNKFDLTLSRSELIWFINYNKNCIELSEAEGYCITTCQDNITLAKLIQISNHNR